MIETDDREVEMVHDLAFATVAAMKRRGLEPHFLVLSDVAKLCVGAAKLLTGKTKSGKFPIKYKLTTLDIVKVCHALDVVCVYDFGR
jgi:hypothetical protein